MSLKTYQTAAKLDVVGYRDALEKATDDTVARYARGNVAAQTESVMDSKSLCKLGKAGDEAAAALSEVMARKSSQFPVSN